MERTGFTPGDHLSGVPVQLPVLKLGEPEAQGAAPAGVAPGAVHQGPNLEAEGPGPQLPPEIPSPGGRRQVSLTSHL